jgi:hypothetical protein
MHHIYDRRGRMFGLQGIVRLDSLQTDVWEWESEAPLP